MTDGQIDAIFDLMKDYAVRAGAVLMRHRGKVVNIGKDASTSAGKDQDEGGLALTVVDGIIQEDFLLELKQLSNRLGLGKSIRINCEEDTRSRTLFMGNTGELCTVHQDPCDGTKPYIDGKDDFATGYGISNPLNRFTHTAIVTPARNRMYLASPSRSEVRTLDGILLDDENDPRYDLLFSKRALNERGKAEVGGLGITVAGVESAHCRIVDIALRNAGAYFYGKANPHDSFIPYAFAVDRGVVPTDFAGNGLDGSQIVVTEKDGLPVFERVPSVVYMPEEHPHRDALMNILSDKRNLEQ